MTSGLMQGIEAMFTVIGDVQTKHKKAPDGT